jgi:hypothetical protein
MNLLDMQERMDCTRCKGSGASEHYRGGCPFCRGAGYFLKPSVTEIVNEIVNKKTKKLYSKRPQSDRAYYVWRLARFHGGKDVTMPIMAGLVVAGDPYVDVLDKIADAVAKIAFGTDMAAASRWLGLEIPGLPASAYRGGPVTIGEKPDEELAELLF